MKQFCNTQIYLPLIITKLDPRLHNLMTKDSFIQ